MNFWAMICIQEGSRKRTVEYQKEFGYKTAAKLFNLPYVPSPNTSLWTEVSEVEVRVRMVCWDVSTSQIVLLLTRSWGNYPTRADLGEADWIFDQTIPEDQGRCDEGRVEFSLFFYDEEHGDQVFERDVTLPFAPIPRRTMIRTEDRMLLLVDAAEQKLSGEKPTLFVVPKLGGLRPERFATLWNQ